MIVKIKESGEIKEVADYIELDCYDESPICYEDGIIVISQECYNWAVEAGSEF